MSDYENENSNNPKEISPGIWLHKQQQKLSQENQELIIWKIELATMSIVDFVVDLSNSKDIKLDNSSSLTNIVQINPFETKEIAKIILNKNSKIKAKFKLNFKVPEKNFQSKIIKNDLLKINNEIEKMKALNYIPFELLSEIEIINHFTQNSIQKFVDIDFPPIDTSFIGLSNDLNIKEDLDYIFHWRRPENFVLLKPENINNKQKSIVKLFHNDQPEPNDIHQEMLPDNYLASALSGIAEKYNLVTRLIKSNKISSFGIYKILLYINGAPKIFVIDDLFPCIPMGNPIVTRSPSNEIWVLLIEKAVAKAMEGYYNIINLSLAECLLMLTGCPTFSFNMEDLINLYDDNELFNKINTLISKDKYLVIVINNQEQDDDENNNNLLVQSNHGYTVREIINENGKILINLRKIWFDSDVDRNIFEYQKKIHEEIYNDNDFNSMDSTILMLLDDFKKEFNSLVVCYTKIWQEIRIRDSFILTKEEKNSNYELILPEHYYILNIDTPTKIIISLFQDEDKFKNNDSRKQIIDISLSLINLYPQTNEITHNQTIDFSHSSNIQIEVDLNQGMYIILPRTSGCFIGKPLENNSIANISNSNLIDKNSLSNKDFRIYDQSEKRLNNLFINIIKDIFNKYDTDIDGFLTYDKFKKLFATIYNKELSEDEFYVNYINIYSSYNNNLSEKGLIQFFENEYLKGGEASIKKIISKLGYDSEVYNNKFRNFILTFHSNKNITVSKKQIFNSDINSKINKILLKNYGTLKENKKAGDIIPIMFQSKLNNVITFGCSNIGNNDLNVKVTFVNNGDILIRYNIMEKYIKAKNIEYFCQFYIINPENIDHLNYFIEF